MASRTLNILAVCDDRSALRHLIKFLTAFGYEVFSAVDVAQATAAIETHPIDFLLVDDRLQSGGAEVCRRLTSDASYQRRYTFLLTKNEDTQKVAEALAAGVDDFLTRPLIYGELLARLRAGARTLEHRRRWSEQQELEENTSLPGRVAFRRHLKQQLDKMRKTSKPVACAVLDMDFFERVGRTFGQLARNTLLKQIAEQLGQLVRPADELSCFDNDRFGLLLNSCSEMEAVKETERICGSLADAEFSCGDSTLALTASAGVACWCRDATEADEIIQRAEKALEIAKNSGRDCVVRFGQFGDETKAWHELARPGRLFESTSARDVMTPCPVMLSLDAPFHKATAIFEQTELLAIPVVDRAGKYAGVVWRESFINGSDVHETYPASHLNGELSEQLDDAVECVAEDASFAELVERLSDDSTPLLVVADAQRPIGLLTSPNLASLSQPLFSDSFRESKPLDDTTRYLAVAEHVQS